MKTYSVKVGNKTYNCVNGVNAQIGDKVIYEWNPNNKIDTVLRFENFGNVLVTSSGRGDTDKWHKIVN